MSGGLNPWLNKRKKSKRAVKSEEPRSGPQRRTGPQELGTYRGVGQRSEAELSLSNELGLVWWW